MLQSGYRHAIGDVVPYTGEMQLIDAIEDYGPDWVRVSVTPRADGLFDQHGEVPAWMGLEYMAQAMAAFSGMELAQQGQPPRIGFLLGTRRCDMAAPAFTVGRPLTVTARLVHHDEQDLVAFNCEIHDGSQRLAAAELKAYRPHDVRAFLEAAP